VSKIWKVIFAVIMGAGLYSMIVRFAQGLGAATNLSDEFPWGLWIGFDILVGVGLAAGGFVIAATVHVFHLKRYEDIARPTILTAFLGYLLVIFALLFDLGRPYRIWHPLVMRNPHSVMFEVAMCVMLYTTVLALEFSPLVFSRLNWKKPLKIVRAIYIPLVILGVLLSTLHQSSLGTLYVIVPDKLYGLWYTPLLPIFFFLSAVAAGLGMTIFESFMSYRAFGKRLEHDLLEGLARVAVVILAVLLVWKLQDLRGRGNFNLIFQVTPESVMFWGEVGLGIVLPMVLFMIPRVRASESGLFLGAMLTIMGFIINRLNVAITGVARASGVNYIPSWMEFAVTTSIVALGFALFGLAVKHLDVFPSEKAEPSKAEDEAPQPDFARHRPAYHGRVLLALWGLLLIGFVFLAFSNQNPATGPMTTSSLTGSVEVRPASGGLGEEPSGTTTGDESIRDLARFAASEPIKLADIEIPMRGDSPGLVVFSHENHVDPRNPSCGTCHAGDFPITSTGTKNESSYLMDTMYEGKSCGKCHNGKDAFAADGDCETCHRP
jgi:c(7)-type cytochrome triheme protein